MQKLAVAATPMTPSADMQLGQTFLLGSAERVDPNPAVTCATDRIDFLAELSRRLLADHTNRRFPDVVAFAFWCRKAALESLAQKYRDRGLRVGLGPVFHLAPSNVPINFAYSLAFGLLAGNTNIVRLPSRHSDQVDIIVSALTRLLDDTRHAGLAGTIHLLRYDHNDHITGYWLANTLGRVIWGGDETIAHMRSLPTHPRSRELAFPDRYSLCAMRADALLALNPGQTIELATRLVNDVILMDQNACSSPHLVAWVGDRATVDRARAAFWPLVEQIAADRYALEPIQAMDKLVGLCREIIESENIEALYLPHPSLSRVVLSSMADDPCKQRVHFGTLHEAFLESLNAMARVIDPRFQTLAYFGFTTKELEGFVRNCHLQGIDRIVPIGQAHQMDFVWDGHELLTALSRVVDIR
jgi:hypothetical protein